ncbi:MAG: putative tyrosine recombinase XerC-like protein [Candidatus Methanofastidiosum methylothiophilum]|uniref:Putative tyrosine recombinase XerC-like protein n=1 Tax=Candidatus Methanofastidiosum methylothiophilum TaxID=1705564 RepID=A0A150JIQ4_9EURY|nr:MAG: putative tyrosine recombinase XerC-like protein [Candidatus Methanofastidiosum methylthiophilus]KYC57095.1 MAG: putative tyrosine recombinase XerC-like protein [Candidatus Methanofastidiosum methylthiophilus]OQC52513.1 MAG: putative tyrosine recombinase XerC-like protein [Euryarchaeota archaeon ADurb.Bin023]
MEEEFYRFLRGKKNLAPGTCKRMLQLMPKGSTNWDENQVQDFYFKTLDRDYSSTHKRHVHYVLKYYSEWKGYNFDYKPPKAHHVRRKNVEMENIWKLLDVITDTRDLALILTHLYSGLRPSELLALKIEDLDLENGMLTVRNTKTYMDRIIPLHKKPLTAIRKYLSTQDKNSPYLFSIKSGNSGLKIQTYQKILRIYSKKAEIKRVTPYMLRHTFSTQFIENGGDVLILKNLLGHSRVSTTEIYIHENPKMIRKGYDKACPEF